MLIVDYDTNDTCRELDNEFVAKWNNQSLSDPLPCSGYKSKQGPFFYRKFIKTRKDGIPIYWYPPEVDSAWLVVRPFLALWDCGYTEHDEVKPFNPNDRVTNAFNHVPDCTLYSITKKDFMDHLNEITTLHYRCKSKVRYSTGYGPSDSHAQAHPLSEWIDLRKKVISQDEYLLVLGLDLDNHSMYSDILDLLDIAKHYFPGCYFESSSHGSGFHYYIKIRFVRILGTSVCKTVAKIRILLNDIHDLFEQVRILSHIESKFDSFRGFPTCYQTIDDRTYITDRPDTIKLPRFNCSYKCTNMEDIVWFYRSPYNTPSFSDRYIS